MNRSIFMILMMSFVFKLSAQNLLLDVDGIGYIRDRLGIGTNDPERDLHILAEHAGGITIQRNSGNFHGLFWRSPDPDNVVSTAINYNHEVGDLVFFNNRQNRLFLKSDGDLQLGSYTGQFPQRATFRVFGNIALGDTYYELEPPENGAIIEGKVAIGTTTISSPDQLHVFDSDRSRITSETSSGSSAGFRSKTNSGEYFTGAQGNRYSIYNNLTNQEPLSVLNDGNIGIGTTLPKEKLHIEKGNLLLTPNPDFQTDIILAENSLASSGSIIRQSTSFGLDILDYAQTEEELVANFRPSGSSIESNSDFAHAFTVYNKSITTTSKGLRVDLNVPSLSPDNHFATFIHRTKIRGKIHGQETLTSLSRPLINSLLGDDPIDEDPTEASEDRDQNPGTSDDPILDFIGSNYGQELLWHSAEFIEAIIVLIANSFSVLDPDDYAACSYAVISEGVKLAVFLAIEELTAGIAYESEGADYAEWLPKAHKNEIISPGDVVGVMGGKISKSFQDASKYMVVSHHPMVIGNMPEEVSESEYEKIAFIGQVPVKTLGKVEIGDFIIPSGNHDGLAQAVHPLDMKAKDYQKIIGTAWSESDTTKIINLINTAVGISTNELAKTVDQMQQLMDHMQRALRKLDPSFQANFYNSGQENNESNNIADLNEHGSVLISDYINTVNFSRTEEHHTIESIRGETFSNVYEELIAQGFDFSYFPDLENILQNPTEENLLKAQEKYTAALGRFGSYLKELNNSKRLHDYNQLNTNEHHQ